IGNAPAKEETMPPVAATRRARARLGSAAVTVVAALALAQQTLAVDPADLDYGYEICMYEQECTTPRAGWVRFGIAGEYVYSSSEWAANYTFTCDEDTFGSDPFPGRTGESCSLSEPDDTPYPTVSPTAYPSVAPTPEPTQRPTTKRPTPQPTPQPTPKPTDPPTNRPTEAPVPPVAYPTPKPTYRPTTGAPTTATPTTLRPTGSPTQDPDVVCPLNKDEALCDAMDNLCDWDATTSACVAAGSIEETAAPTSVGSSGLGWVAILATNIAIVGIVLALSALIFIHIHRDKPVIQLSQLLFLKLLCVGGIFVNTSIFPSAFEPESAAVCIVRKWWFDLAFTFTMAVLLLKIWRVWRVFYGPGDASHITDMFLLKIIALLVAIDVVLLILWTAIEPPVSYFNEDMGAYDCESTGVGYVMLIISYIFLGALVVLGVVLAFRVRNLGSVLGESKQIFFIVNNVLVFGIFNIIVSVLAETSYELRVLLFAFTVFWCTAVGLVVLLFAKYEKFSMTREEILFAATENNKSTRSAGASNNTGPAGTDYNTGASRPSGPSGPSGNTGFVAKQEILQASSNNASRATLNRQGSKHHSPERPQQDTGYITPPEVGLYPRGEYEGAGSQRYLGGARTTLEPPVDERDIFATYNTRSYTDNARAVHVPFRDNSERMSVGSGAASNSSSHASNLQPHPQHHRQRSSGAGSSTNNSSTPPLSISRRNSDSYSRDISLRMGERSQGAASSSTAAGGGLGASAGTSFSFPNSAELASHAKAAAPKATAPTSPPPVASASSSAGEAKTSRPANSKAATVIANGFKIGEVGSWEEYVHRETGESFWVSVETGDISSSPPKEVDLA
ncbi:Metabotropic glutamate receptor, partial [Hondaea fermentalgiana]